MRISDWSSDVCSSDLDSADTAGMPLTPVAVIEAKVAASNMLNGTTTAPNYTGIPTAVFTIPELARVGMLEAEARDRGIDLTRSEERRVGKGCVMTCKSRRQP